MSRHPAEIGKSSNITFTDLSKHPWSRKTKSGTVVVESGWRARGRVKVRRGKGPEVCIVRPTKGEAEREAKRRLATLEARISARIAADAPRTVTDLAERWLAAKAKTVSTPTTKQKPAGKKVRAKRRLSPNTLATYENAARGVIVKHLGDHLVEDLSVVELDELFEALDEAMSTEHARTVLRQMLNWAIAKGLASSNPMLGVSPSNRDEREVEALKPKHARRLLAIARADIDAHRTSNDGQRMGGRRPNRDLADIVVFGLGTGARIGEMLAVRVRDLSLDGRVPTVDICGTMIEPRVGHIAERFRQDYTKNKGRRRVPLPDAVVEMLRDRLSSSPFTGPDDFVFASSKGTPLWAANIRTRLRRLVRDDEVLQGTSPHTLRRTVATRLYTGPGGLQDACDVLGHNPGGVTFKHYVERRRVNKRVRKRLDTFFKMPDPEGGARQ